MTSRWTWAALAATALLAACSGNIGGGQSTLPGAPPAGTNGLGPQSVAVAAPSPTPTAAAAVLTVSGGTSPQPLPPVAGWAGSVAFATASPAPVSPQASAAPAGGAPLSVGVNVSLAAPSGSPHLDAEGGRRKHASGVSATGHSKGLLFVALTPTADLALAAVPQFAIDVPAEICSVYAGRTFALALYNPGKSARSFTLDVATGSAAGEAVPTPTPTPLAAASMPPAAMGPGSTSTLPTPPAPMPMMAAPGEHIVFAAPAMPLTIKANETAVFAVYALAPPSPSPSPSAAPKGGDSPSPVPSPVPSAQPSAAATASPLATAAPAGSPPPTR